MIEIDLGDDPYYADKSSAELTLKARDKTWKAWEETPLHVVSLILLNTPLKSNR